MNISNIFHIIKSIHLSRCVVTTSLKRYSTLFHRYGACDKLRLPYKSRYIYNVCLYVFVFFFFSFVRLDWARSQQQQHANKSFVQRNCMNQHSIRTRVSCRIYLAEWVSKCPAVWYWPALCSSFIEPSRKSWSRNGLINHSVSISKCFGK